MAQESVLQSDVTFVGAGGLELAWTDKKSIELSRLYIEWNANDANFTGPPLVLCSSLPPRLFSSDSEGEKVELATKPSGDHYLTSLTPLVPGAKAHLVQFGVIRKDCSYVDSREAESLWSIELRFIPDQQPFRLLLKAGLLPGFHNETGEYAIPLQDDDATSGEIAEGGGSSSGGDDFPQQWPGNPGFHQINSIQDSVRVIPFLRVNKNSAPVVEKSILIIYTIDGQRVTANIPVSQWRELQQSGITFSKLCQFIAKIIRRRQDRQDATGDLDRLLAWQEEAGQFEGDESVITSLLARIGEPDDLVISAGPLGELPPGTVFFGRKKKKGQGNPQEDSSVSKEIPPSETREVQPPGKPPSENGAAAPGAPTPPPPALEKEVADALARLNLPGIIYRARLSSTLRELRVLFGFYGGGLIAIKRLVELLDLSPEQRGDELMEMAREVTSPETKLSYLQVIHLYLTHHFPHKIQSLLRQLPPKVHASVARYPIPNFAGVNEAADLIPPLGYAVALSLLVEKNAEQFNALMSEYLLDVAEITQRHSALEVTNALFLACMWKGRRKPMLKLYQETPYKEVIQGFLNPEYIQHLDKADVDDLSNALPKSGKVELHTLSFRIGKLVVRVLTRYPAWTAEQLEKLNQAFMALPNPELGGEVIIPRGVLNDLGIVELLETTVLDTISDSDLPKGLESLTPVIKSVERQGKANLSRHLVSAIFENPGAVKRLVNDNEYTAEMLIFTLASYIIALDRQLHLPKHQLSLMKTLVLNLDALRRKKTLKYMMPIPDTAIQLGVTLGQIYKDGNMGLAHDGKIPGALSFVWLAVHLLNSCLHTYQIFTRDFARELAECLSAYSDRQWAELGAGTGMFTSVLNEHFGMQKVMHTSDAFMPGDIAMGKKVLESLYPDVSLTVKRAETVIPYFDETVLYLISQANSEMLKKLIRSGKKLLILATGWKAGSVFEQFDRGRLKVFELNIPTYTAIKFGDGVRLIMVNTPEHEYREIVAKIPEKYRLGAVKTTGKKKKSKH